VAAGEGVDQQEAQGEQEDQDSYPRSPAPHSPAVAAAAPAISARLVRRCGGVGSAACGPRAAAGASGAGNGEPLASLQLGELPDVVAVFPRVLAGIDPLRPQVLSGDAEDLGEVGANPFLAILLAAAALTVGGVCRSRSGTRISHASNCTSPDQRTGSLVPAPTGPWSSRVLLITDPERRAYLTEIAGLMDVRKDRIGEYAARHALPWAVTALGPVPEDPQDRAEWQK
jgi:hypothetical protein